MKNINTDVLIVGGGPVGLFAVFELGQLGIKSCVIDCLDEIGGQCSALYPEKPIYDIPAYPVIKAEELVEKLKKQIQPFKPEIILNQKVNKFFEKNNSFQVITSNNVKIDSKCIFIAAGSGAFGPNKPPLKDIDKYENKSIFYTIKNRFIFKFLNIFYWRFVRSKCTIPCGNKYTLSRYFIITRSENFE